MMKGVELRASSPGTLGEAPVCPALKKACAVETQAPVVTPPRAPRKKKRFVMPESTPRVPFAQATQADRQSLIQIRTFVEESKEELTYNGGGDVRLGLDGTVSFSDLTMEMVPLALGMATDARQKARLLELRTDWPGGADPLMPEASYVRLVKSGEIDRRIAELEKIRAKDEFGIFRRAGNRPLAIGGYNLNVGEEREISGTQGSGTVYFSGCSMKCSFCQYNDIAQRKGGVEHSVNDLARVMLDLQERGAHNIQLMTPSHYVVEVVKALKIAAEQGLRIPLVYNTGGMEDLRALEQLEGIVDVYLPDMKFGTDEAGLRYGRVEGYVENTQAAIREMFRQVGNLKVDDRQVATKGVMVRHLIMPDDVAKARPIAQFLASVSKDLAVSVLDQWTPTHLAYQTPEINRKLTEKEIDRAVRVFRTAGLHVDGPGR
jgi:putative pyruvate formate lyase activating enzyme